MDCPVPDRQFQPAQRGHRRAQLSPLAELVVSQGNVFKKGQERQTGRGRENKKEQAAAEGTPGPEEAELHSGAGISFSPQRTHTRADSLCSLWRTWATAKERWEKEGAE